MIRKNAIKIRSIVFLLIWLVLSSCGGENTNVETNPTAPSMTEDIPAMLPSITLGAATSRFSTAVVVLSSTAEARMTETNIPPQTATALTAEAILSATPTNTPTRQPTRDLKINPYIPATPENFGNNVIMMLKRHGCFGTCPMYIVMVYGSGKVEFEGILYVAVEGKRVYDIPLEDARRLFDEFYLNNFFSLHYKYGSQMLDVKSDTISITIDGYTKTVNVDGLEPPEFNRLLITFRKLSGVGDLLRGSG